MGTNEDLQLARITTDREWQAYKTFVDREFLKRGIESEPLPEERPQPSTTSGLNQTIQQMRKLWERDKPLQTLKAFGKDLKAAVLLTAEQLKEETGYYSSHATTHIQNTLSGAASIVEDTLGLTPSKPYDWKDFLSDNPEQTIIETDRNDSGILNSIIEKGTKDIATVETAVYSFFDKFRGR